MNPEIIAILNARSPDMRMLPRGHGALSQIDIAHALGRVEKDGPRYLGRVLWAEQDMCAVGLADCLYNDLLSHARRHRWKNINPLYRLSRLSIALYCYPQRCKKCKGIGQRHIANKVYICARCNGSTWNVDSQSALAWQIGVGKDAWSRVWESRLKDALAILGDMERSLLKDLSKIMA